MSAGGEPGRKGRLLQDPGQMPRLGFVWWAVATRVITLVPGWITHIRRKLDYKEARSEVTRGESGHRWWVWRNWVTSKKQ